MPSRCRASTFAVAVTMALAGCPADDEPPASDAGSSGTSTAAVDSTGGPSSAAEETSPLDAGTGDGGTTAQSGTSDGAVSSGSGGSSESSSGSGVAACVDLGGDRAEINEGALVAGVVVTLTEGDTRGRVTVPLLQPLPDADMMTITFELFAAVGLIVSSDATGSSADFGAATIAMAMLANPGEYTWDVDDDRCEVTLRFVNETPFGFTLQPGGAYTVQVSVAPNDYVETLPAISFSATIESE